MRILILLLNTNFNCMKTILRRFPELIAIHHFMRTLYIADTYKQMERKRMSGEHALLFFKKILTYFYVSLFCILMHTLLSYSNSLLNSGICFNLIGFTFSIKLCLVIHLLYKYNNVLLVTKPYTALF